MSYNCHFKKQENEFHKTGISVGPNVPSFDNAFSRFLKCGYGMQPSFVTDQTMMTMCRFKKLCYADQGYVIRCNHCRHIHIAFGTAILAYTQDQYNDFARTVNDLYQLYKDHLYRDQKIIQIPTDARSITLALHNFRAG